jgi:Bacterial cadherin-like domain
LGDIRRRWLIAGTAVAMALAPVGASTVLAAGDAVDDPYTITEDQSLIADGVANPGVLANDSTDAGTLCVVSFDTTSLQGSFGAAADGNGLFEYQPPANFNGTTTFTYGVASDLGAGCPSVAEDTATVTITVTPVNDAPTAANDSFAALTDRTLNVAAPGVLGNDSDIDGDSLTAAVGSGPAHGVLTLAGNGGFSYSPNTGYTGSDAFSYRASDGQAQSGIRVVSLTVTALPPPPTPTPAPTPTPEPTPSPEPSPSESPLQSDSPLPTSTPSQTGLPSASPSASPVTSPVLDGDGPPPLAIGALALLIGLLVIAGVYFVRSQRSGEEAAYETGAYDNLDSDGLEPDDFVDDERG